MTRGLHVLQLATVRWYNACADYALRLTAGLTERGHRVVIGGYPGSPLLEEAKALGLTVVEAFDFRPGRWDAPWTLARFRHYLRKSRFDIVNAHRAEDHSFAALALLPRRQTLLIRTRGDVRPPKKGVLNRLLYERWTDAHVLAGNFMRKRFYDGFNLRPDRLFVLKPGLDVEKFSRGVPDKLAARRALGLQGAPWVGLIGRFTRAKGHLVALEAFARVARELPQTRFLLSGDPFDISEGFLRERAGDLGLSEAVVFLPRQSDVRVVMSALDVGVVASLRSEAICRVALEYQALGVPVVGTDLNSIPEMVANRTTGLIVSTNDAGSLARAVIRLLEEPELQAKLSAAGPDHIRKNYSYDDWISRTESLYRFLIKRPA